jgi:hypothetical protein
MFVANAASWLGPAICKPGVDGCAVSLWLDCATLRSGDEEWGMDCRVTNLIVRCEPPPRKFLA